MNWSVHLMLGLGLAVVGSGCTEVVFEEDYARLRSITIGMSEAEPIAYVYFDPSNRVEYVFVGGS